MKIFTRRLFAAMAFVACSVGVNAQAVDNTFRFVDSKTGAEIPDGGTYNVTAELIDKMPDMPGLIVKLEAPFDIEVENTTSEVAYVSANVVTNSMSSGSLQFCFPNQCPPTVPADYTTDTGVISANGKKSLQAEWIPEEGKSGTAQFTVQLRTMKVTKWNEFNGTKIPAEFAFEANGPKITIKCAYDATGIAGLAADKDAVVNVYNLAGKAVLTNRPASALLSLGKGLYICETVKNGKRVAVKKIVK